jgi:hypothetical protein
MEAFMTPKSRDRDRGNEAQLDELGDDPGHVGSDSAGQSGDSQGLSDIAESAAESVEELADTDQAYEAEAIQGVEDAGDHPERQVRSHQDRRSSNQASNDRDWE